MLLNTNSGLLKTCKFNLLTKIYQGRFILRSFILEPLFISYTSTFNITPITILINYKYCRKLNYYVD